MTPSQAGGSSRRGFVRRLKGGWAGQEGAGGCFQGRRVAECLQARHQAAGLTLGAQAADEAVAAELVAGFAGGQDVPGDHEDGVGDDDDGLAFGDAGSRPIS